MANVGNKGKFSDRLKRMKLIRNARKMNMKVNGLSLEKNNDVKKVVTSGVSISIFFVGSAINKLINSNQDKKSDNLINDNVNNNVEISKNGLNAIASKDKKEVLDNKNTFSKDSNKENKTNVNNDTDNLEFKDSIKNKAIGIASVGAAVAGAAVVNLLGGDSNKVDSISSNKKHIVDDVNVFNDNKDVVLTSDGVSVFNHNKDIILVNGISNNDIKNGNKKTYLAIQIIKKTKKEFEKKLDELEVLESDLYYLNDKNQNSLDLEECKKIKSEIQTLVNRINHIIEQFDIYKNNEIFLNTLEIDDTTLADDISEFRNLYNEADLERRLESDYDLIKKYQSLYSKLEDVKINLDDVQKKNEDKIIDYENRDNRYENMKKNAANIDKFNSDCKYYINKQNDYIDDISSKISKINVEEIVNYKFRGFGNLVSGTFRYLTMMFTMPFVSTLPGIAFRSYASNMMINNLRNALRLEKITNTVYNVQDFQYELDRKINDIDYNNECLFNSIDNVKKLKKEFMEQYSYDIPGYNDVLKKINGIEDLLYDNQIKLNSIKNKLKLNKKINQEAIHKCRILEKNSKPIVEKL